MDFDGIANDGRAPLKRTIRLGVYGRRARARLSGFARGRRLLYESHSASEAEGKISNHLCKKTPHRIYANIALRLAYHIREDALALVGGVLRTTFCDNAWAVQRRVAGIAPARMGQHGDRPFWSIGRGGFEGSLSQTVIRNAMSHMRG